MYKFNRSKMFKLIAMVMVVAMLASVCMVEAFAAVRPGADVAPCASGTFQGQSISASFGRTSSGARLNCFALCSVNMGVYVAEGGHIQVRRADGTVLVTGSYKSGTYYGYDLTIPFDVRASQASATVEFALNVPVVFGYNGQSYTLATTTRWI